MLLNLKYMHETNTFNDTILAHNCNIKLPSPCPVSKLVSEVVLDFAKQVKFNPEV